MEKPPSQGGVFARNHRLYLENAAEIGRLNPSRLVTFRSRDRWRTALDLVIDHGEVPIYFAVKDEGASIRFKARLRRIVLEPRSKDPETKRLLKWGVAPAKELLWGGNVKTLYAISGCYELPHSFPMTHLKKWNGGEPIAANYKYSYLPIIVDDEDRTTEALVASDINSPPPRSEARVNRIIRDTAVVRRLKRLHNDHCQRCGLRLELADGSAYSEGHHLKPLGSPHDGPDFLENIVVLCPNCHALLDLCGVKLELGGLRVHPEHSVGSTYLKYHNDLFRARRRKSR